MILTVDLGTSLTKVALWAEDGIVAVGRSRLETDNAPGGRAEQDPVQWWRSVTEACGAALAQAPGDHSVEAIGFSAARQSFVPVDSRMAPLGRGLLWSDRRAGPEAAELVARFGGVESLRELTGLYVDAGAFAAKIAWLAVHERDRIERARWLLSPRDLVAWQMTGEVATDETLASASGLYAEDGSLSEDLIASLDALLERRPGVASRAQVSPASHGIARLLPEPMPPSSILGALHADAARDLGLAPGIPVVIGAGDRACEVIGAGASPTRPMVSWGTTANVSVPAPGLPRPIPRGMIATRSAVSGWLFEGGLSAAGSLLEWLARLAGTDVDSLVGMGKKSPPGANGVIVTPWLGGARAPWWRPDATACVLGLSPVHGIGDLARAAVEGVALDVARCVEWAYSESGPEGGAGPAELVLGGAGSVSGLWTEVLTGTTGLAATRRRSGEAASAGAASLAGRAVGVEVDLEKLDPVVARIVPEPQVVERYRALRPGVDEVARSVLSTTEAPIL